MVVFIVSCDRVVKEAHKMLFLAYELKWSFPTISAEDKQELYEFSNFVSKHLPQFSAASLFKIERSTILDILGTACTFLIIIIQFRSA